MRHGYRISSLIPSGFAVEGISERADTIIVTARSVEEAGRCLVCGQASRNVHSRYVRRIADLPSSGRRVDIELDTRINLPFGGVM